MKIFITVKDNLNPYKSQFLDMQLRMDKYAESVT
jgi:hypothetical protein